MGGKPWKPRQEEVVIATSVGVCLLLCFIPKFQVVTAAITALLVGQTSKGIEWRAGAKRIVATALGGAAGVGVAAAEVFFQAEAMLPLLVVIGMIVTLVGCRVLQMPEFSDRVSGITFILVAMSIQGTQRIPYAVFRLVSTLAGVLIWIAVAYVFSLLFKPRCETARSVSQDAS